MVTANWIAACGTHHSRFPVILISTKFASSAWDKKFTWLLGCDLTRHGRNIFKIDKESCKMYQEKTASMALSSVPSRMETDEDNVWIVGRDIQHIEKKTHWPSPCPSFTAVCANHLIQCVHSWFAVVVINYHCGFLCVVADFRRSMIWRYQNHGFITFRHVWNDCTVWKKSEHWTLNMPLWIIGNTSAGSSGLFFFWWYPSMSAGERSNFALGANLKRNCRL